jgi:hypothetical protein
MKISKKKQRKNNHKKSRLLIRNLQMTNKSHRNLQMTNKSQKKSIQKSIQKENFQNWKQIGGYDNPFSLPVRFEINNSRNEQYTFSTILGNPINQSDEFLTVEMAVISENAQPRINSQSGWVSATKDGWVSIDLLNKKKVAGVAIQGKYCGSFESINDDWEGLNKISIFTSTDYENFMDQGIFETNIPKNDTIQYIFFENPVQARFITISAANYQKSVSMRVDALLEKKFVNWAVNPVKLTPESIRAMTTQQVAQEAAARAGIQPPDECVKAIIGKVYGKTYSMSWDDEDLNDALEDLPYFVSNRDHLQRIIDVLVAMKDEADTPTPHATDRRYKPSNLEDIDLSDIINTDAESINVPEDRGDIYNLNFALNDSSTYTYTSKTEISPYNDDVQPLINSPYGCVFDTNDTHNVLVINLNAIKNVIGLAIQGYNCQNMNDCENWEGPFTFLVLLHKDEQNWENPGTFKMEEIDSWTKTSTFSFTLQNDKIYTIFFFNLIKCQYIGIVLLDSLGKKKGIRADALILDNKINIARPELGPVIYRNCTHNTPLEHRVDKTQNTKCERWLPYVIYTQCTDSCDKTWTEEWTTLPTVDEIEPRLVLDPNFFLNKLGTNVISQQKHYDAMMEEYKILRKYGDYSETGIKQIENSKSIIDENKKKAGELYAAITNTKYWGVEYRQNELANVMNYGKYYYMIALKMYKIGQYAEAALHYRNAIQLGHIPSRAKLAWLLLFGRKGIQQSVKQAYELVKNFNNNNDDCKSIKYLIMIFTKDDEILEDMQRNQLNKEILYSLVKKISDERSNMYANLCVGLMEINNADTNDKFKYLHRTYKQQLDLGIYFFGYINEDIDSKINNYNLSASQGFPNALWQLGFLYKERNQNQLAIKYFLEFLETEVDFIFIWNQANCMAIALANLEGLGYKKELPNAARFERAKKELAELTEKLQSLQQSADKKVASRVDGGGALANLEGLGYKEELPNAARFERAKKELAELAEKRKSLQQPANEKVASGALANLEGLGYKEELPNAARFERAKKELAELTEKRKSLQQPANEKVASGVDGGGAKTYASRTVTTRHFNKPTQ